MECDWNQYKMEEISFKARELECAEAWILS